MPSDPQAIALNESIKAENNHVFDLLSQRGKNIFFPKQGILSQSADARGKKINATIGTALEDDGTPMVLNSLDSLSNLKKTEGFSYAPSSGRPEIRSIWNEMLRKKNPSLAEKSVSLPVVTSALTHGLSMGAYLFVDEGENVISPDRYWENYNLVFTNGYKAPIRTFPTFIDNVRFNIDGLRNELLGSPSGKKIVLLNFPNNPTGYTVSRKEAHFLRSLFVEAAEAGNDLVIFIDDAYFGLVYEEETLNESMFGFLADAHERILAIKFDGPTKEDYVWGFRVGFMTFGVKGGTQTLYSALEAKLSGAIRGNISNASNIGQSLLLSAYKSATYDDEKAQKYDTLLRRYKRIVELLEERKEFEEYFYALPFNSGYFMCIKIVSGNAEAIRKHLLEKYDTGLIAQGDVLRIAFSSTPLSLIDELFDNCYRAAKECTGK